MDNSVIFAVSNRSLGNMSLNHGDTEKSLDNRKQFLGVLGIEYQDLVCAKQIHGSVIRYVNENDKGKGAFIYDEAIRGADALITDKKNIPLAVFTADCLSVFMYEPASQVIGIVHAGWRGTKDNICPKAVKLIHDKFGVTPSDLLINFGPCIRSCCYEVSSEFKDFFPDSTSQRDGKYYFDLAAANKAQLIKAGVKEKVISDERVCTSCQNTAYFSFRKEKDKSGRMMAVAMLK